MFPPKSYPMQRRIFIKNASLASGLLLISPLMADCSPRNEEFPVMDLHVHTTNDFTIENILEIGKREHIRFGVLDHPADWAIKDDADLKSYIDRLRPYPVYIGLQPMSPGWTKRFSPELISKVDYVLMDPQTIPNGNRYGETLHIWEFDTYIDDPEDFMERYMAHIMEVLNNNEPMHIFGWPLFLPVCIARDYYALWTENRMQQIITAAKKKNVAIEINDLAHTPHEKFILMSKEQGLKFTFGSDTRNQKAGRLAYCKSIAKKCNLKPEDFFIPQRTIKGGIS